jgi:flagellar biosynthesis chaperone FliJ
MKNLHKKAIWKYGADCQLLKAIEEMKELIHELNEYLDGRGEITFIAEEMADVQNMINQIQIIFDISDDEKESMMKSKMERCFNETVHEMQERKGLK